MADHDQIVANMKDVLRQQVELFEVCKARGREVLSVPETVRLQCLQHQFDELHHRLLMEFGISGYA